MGGLLHAMEGAVCTVLLVLVLCQGAAAAPKCTATQPNIAKTPFSMAPPAQAVDWTTTGKRPLAFKRYCFKISDKSQHLVNGTLANCAAAGYTAADCCVANAAYKPLSITFQTAAACYAPANLRAFRTAWWSTSAAAVKKDPKTVAGSLRKGVWTLKVAPKADLSLSDLCVNIPQGANVCKTLEQACGKLECDFNITTAKYKLPGDKKKQTCCVRGAVSASSPLPSSCKPGEGGSVTAVACQPCQPGTFGVGLNSSTPCRPCPSNAISSAAGASTCTACPVNETANADRTACVPNTPSPGNISTTQSILLQISGACPSQAGIDAIGLELANSQQSDGVSVAYNNGACAAGSGPVLRRLLQAAPVVNNTLVFNITYTGRELAVASAAASTENAITRGIIDKASPSLEFVLDQLNITVVSSCMAATCHPVCRPGCVNGACIDGNICNCTGTAFTGTTCQTAVNCSAENCATCALNQPTVCAMCAPKYALRNGTCSENFTLSLVYIWTMVVQTTQIATSIPLSCNATFNTIIADLMKASLMERKDVVIAWVTPAGGCSVYEATPDSGQYLANYTMGIGATATFNLKDEIIAIATASPIIIGSFTGGICDAFPNASGTDNMCQAFAHHAPPDFVVSSSSHDGPPPLPPVVNCTAANCASCALNSTTYCATCADEYTLLNGTCLIPVTQPQIILTWSMAVTTTPITTSNMSSCNETFNTIIADLMTASLIARGVSDLALTVTPAGGCSVIEAAPPNSGQYLAKYTMSIYLKPTSVNIFNLKDEIIATANSSLINIVTFTGGICDAFPNARATDNLCQAFAQQAPPGFMITGSSPPGPPPLPPAVNCTAANCAACALNLTTFCGTCDFNYTLYNGTCFGPGWVYQAWSMVVTTTPIMGVPLSCNATFNTIIAGLMKASLKARQDVAAPPLMVSWPAGGCSVIEAPPNSQQYVAAYNMTISLLGATYVENEINAAANGSPINAATFSGGICDAFPNASGTDNLCQAFARQAPPGVLVTSPSPPGDQQAS